MVVHQALTNDSVPRDVREKALKQSYVIVDILKQLIIEGQAAGQVVSGDPTRLATVYNWCIEGAGVDAAFFNTPSSSSPTAEDVLRILRP